MNNSWSFKVTLNDLLLETPWFTFVLFADAPDPNACRAITGYFFGAGLWQEQHHNYTQTRYRYIRGRIWRSVSLYNVEAGKCDRLGNPIR